LAYISGLDNPGEQPIGVLDSPDFRDTFFFFKRFSTTTFKQVMSTRVFVKNEAIQKNSDFSVLAFRNSIPVFIYTPKAEKEY
jgi:hypothetical protein